MSGLQAEFPEIDLGRLTHCPLCNRRWDKHNVMFTGKIIRMFCNPIPKKEKSKENQMLIDINLDDLQNNSEEVIKRLENIGQEDSGQNTMK